MSETYTVHMNGETFRLSRAHIEFDTPNFFTSCFLGEFAESQTRTVTLYRDPELFKIVLDHMNGYEVLPLHESVIPRRMSPDMAVRNLLADARFYLLNGLVEKLELFIPKNQRLEATPMAGPHTHMLLIYDSSPNSDNKFSQPIPLSEDAAGYFKRDYGVDLPSYLFDFRMHDAIQEVLRQVQVVTPYAIEAIWGNERDKWKYLLKIQ